VPKDWPGGDPDRRERFNDTYAMQDELRDETRQRYVRHLSSAVPASPPTTAWNCPACQAEIRHSGVAPQPGLLYRCHLCHLELTLDDATKILAVAAPPTNDPRR
jgi:hypothetical protein